ncbi:hypothetical protein U9M48_038700 [Paspalum notatum var. saurae]|uniref:KIB1-4 beta-propeller domain-containing protein n=1 Tax=Paspalum notatum var. saurae TaxID=547442 RepID=A0AAQ3XBC0_PASNO
MSSSSYRNRRRTRRRRTTEDAATATRDSPWASLHEDLVNLIGWRVLASDLRDYICFCAVCRHWRSSTKCPRGRGIVDRRFHPRRWMMLPEGHGIYPGHGKLRGFVRFFNLSTGAFVRVHLPLFKDHCVLDSVDGLLVLQRDHDTAVRLLHPFTGDILDFPPLENLLGYASGPSTILNPWCYVRNFRATAISVSANDVVTLMLIQLCMTKVAFATSGMQEWTLSLWIFHQYHNALSFQGKLYAVNHFSSNGVPEILQIDPPQMQGTELVLQPPKVIAKCPTRTTYASFICHLVECGSEILVVSQKYTATSHSQFSVCRLADFMLGRIVCMTSVSGNALFIHGNTRTICVSSKTFPTIVADTVVFIDNKKSCLAQYHLSSGTLSPASDGSFSGPCTKSL